MKIHRGDLASTSVSLILLSFLVVAVDSLKIIGDKRKKVDTILKHLPKYFPSENNLCVVQAEDDEFSPVFNVPVVVYTQDHVLQDCGGTSTDHDGYVLITSNIANFEEEILPLLKCFNRTNLKLKTKYILVLDVSENGNPNYEDIYSNFFHKLWKSFGIINIAILPVTAQNLDTEIPFIFLYNPFLARQNQSPEAFIKISLTQDIRHFMIDRFRNMNGHRLRAVFYRFRNGKATLKDLDEKQSLGADIGILFKQILEEKLNVKFDIYESSPEKNRYLKEEFFSGRAEYCINDLYLGRVVDWTKIMQVVSSGFSLDLVFVVPTPKHVESWRYFQYIFPWNVWIGLVIVLSLLSCAALLLHYVQSTKVNPLSQNSSGTSEVVSVWKAALSAGINKLPTTPSQRFLITLSLFLGLIFVTLFSAKLFQLIKSKPRLAPLKTLQDLHDSNLPIYTVYKQFALFLNVFENTTLHRLKDNLKTDTIYENSHYMDPKYLNITDRALVFTDTMVQVVKSLPQGKEIAEYLDVLKEPIIKTMMLFYLPIDSVYYEQFNNLNHKVMDSGLFLKWQDALAIRAGKHYSASSNLTNTQASGRAEEDHEPLTYNDLKMAFYTLYVGLTISSLCFFMEVCSMKPLQWLKSRF